LQALLSLLPFKFLPGNPYEVAPEENTAIASIVQDSGKDEKAEALNKVQEKKCLECP
jgi:hypothetical protein